MEKMERITYLAGIFIVFFTILVLGICLILAVLDLIPSEDCSSKISILKSVNGPTDKDSGLFSSGDTSTTTLLFDDGTLITLHHRIDKLKLNSLMTIKECRPILGSKSIITVK